MGKIEGKTRKFIPRNPNQRRILEEIKKKDQTYTEIKKTLIDERNVMCERIYKRHLKYLKENNVIEKYRSGGKEVYQLNFDFAGPIEATLRNLDSLTKGNWIVPETSPLDLKRGRELLTEKIAEIVVKISRYEYNSNEKGFREKEDIPMVSPKTGEEIPPKPLKDRINELKFIKSIARYWIEKGCLKNPQLRGTETKAEDDLLVEELREIKSDPHFFPAVGTLEKRDPGSETIEKFDKLGEWIRPIRKGGGPASRHFHQEVDKHFDYISFIMKRLIENK